MQTAVKEDIYKLELKLEQSNSDLKLKIEQTRGDLFKAIEQTKGDLYKAMFWTGLVQLLAILGGMMAIVKFIR